MSTVSGRWITWLVVLLAVAAPPLAYVGGASAADVTRIDGCTVIDQPGTYELTADVTGLDVETCIHIAADDVTLRGNGHTLGAVADPSQHADGVLIGGSAGGVSDVTVTGLSLSGGWAQAIEVRRSARVTVSRVTVDGGWEGILLSNVDDLVMDDLTLAGMDRYAIRANDGSSVVLRNTTIENTGSLGARFYGVNDVTVTRVTLDGTRGGLEIRRAADASVTDVTVTGSGSHGIEVFETPNVLVADVEVRRANRWGVIVGAATNATVRDALVVNGDHGIKFTGTTDSRIVDSTVRTTDGTAIRLDDGANRNLLGNNTIDGTTNGDGIAVWYSNENVLEANEVRDVDDNGIRLNGYEDDPIVNNVVRKNTVTGAQRGIHVQRGVRNALLEDNRVLDNRQHGIRLAGAGVTDVRLVGNVVGDNEEHGIVFYRTATHLVRNNTVVGNQEHGLYFDDTSRVVVENTNASGNAGWAVYLTEGATDNTFTRVTIGPNTVVSFTGKNAAIRAVTGSATLATIGDDDTYSRYLEVANTRRDAWIEITVHYPDNVEDEESLGLYRHDGAWAAMDNATLDTDANVASVNVTAFPENTYYALNLPANRETPTPTPHEPTVTTEPPEEAEVGVDTPAGDVGGRGFFTNDGAVITFLDASTLTIVGIVLSVLGIVVELMGWRG